MTRPHLPDDHRLSGFEMLLLLLGHDVELESVASDDPTFDRAALA